VSATDSDAPQSIERAHEAVLDFWFGPLRDPSRERVGALWRERERAWFRADPDFDRRIAERFGDAIEAALAGALAAWSQQPRARLALILLLDQFTRNVFRGTARAYAGDAGALALARNGVAGGMDRALGLAERAFFYMPFQHAEDAVGQVLGVAAYERLLGDAPAAIAPNIENFLRSQREHCDVITRFGRFPHRNAIVGRASTSAEAEYLSAGAPTYGQAPPR